MTLIRNQKSDSELHKKSNGRIVLWCVLATVGMFAFGFALVPIYNVLCEVTGLNGKTRSEAVILSGDQRVDESRLITVQFIANINENTPLEFRAMAKTIQIHPGEIYDLAYYAKNISDQPFVAQGIPSVAPGMGARYIQKTECFCFKQQTFAPGQEMIMPVRFVLDYDLPERIKILTISYTMFDTKKGVDPDYVAYVEDARDAWRPQ